MLKDFRTYQLAVQFHRECVAASVPRYLRDQLLRASSSIVLNIAEGSGKPTSRDQRKFYGIALGSLRESVAALEIVGGEIAPSTLRLADRLGGHLFRLCSPK